MKKLARLALPVVVSLGLLFGFCFSSVRMVEAATPITFYYKTFSDNGLLVFNGAARIDTGRLLVCPNGSGFGSVFNKNMVSLANHRSFSTYFAFQFTSPANGGADGMVFTLQTDANSAGTSGGGLGYQGISPSVAVEFDTYDNSETVGGVNGENHVAIEFNGVLSQAISVSAPMDLDGGGAGAGGPVCYAWIDYDGAYLDVYLTTDKANKGAPILSYPIDLESRLGADVYAGFTAATGGSSENHWVYEWYFNNDYAPIDPAQVYTQAPSAVSITSAITGSKTAEVTTTAKYPDGTAAPGVDVGFSTDAGILSTKSAVTDANGKASATITCDIPGALAHVRATVTGGAYADAGVTFPPNADPVANPDFVAGVEDTPLVIDAAALVANDIDADDDILTLTAVSATASTHGTVELAGTTVTYTPEADYFGEADFEYTLADGRGGAATGTVGVTLAGVEDLPEAGGDTVVVSPAAGTDALITEDAVQPEFANICLVVPHLYDPDGGPLPSQIKILAVTGGVLQQGNGSPISVGSGAAGTAITLSGDYVDLRFTPSSNRDVDAFFTYGVVNPGNPNEQSAASTATVPILPVNDPPSIQSASDLPGGLKGMYYLRSNALTGPYTVRVDADVNFVSSASSGSYVWGIGGINPEMFSVRWTGKLRAPATGTYTFTTTSDDGVRLWVGGERLIDDWTLHAPTVDSASKYLVAGEFYSVTLEYYERGGGETIRLYWTRPGGLQETIPAANLYPGALPDQTIAEDGSAGVSFSVVDIDTDTGSLWVSASSSDQVMLPDANIYIEGSGSDYSVAVFPAADQYGASAVTVMAGDGEFSVTEQFSVTVNPVNDAPTIGEMPTLSIDEDEPGSVVIPVGDVDNSLAELHVTVASSNPAVIPDDGLSVILSGGEYQLVVTPAANVSGTAAVQVVATDPEGLQASSMFDVQVLPVNDAPTLDLLADLVVDEDCGDLIVNLTGITAGPLENQPLTITAMSDNGSVIPDPEVTYASPAAVGTLAFSPVANANGTAIITVMVDDGQLGGRFSRSFRVTVNPVDDPPTITQGETVDVVMDEDSSPTAFSLALHGINIDRDSLVWTVSSGPANGEATVLGVGDNGVVSYTPTANYNGDDTFTISLTDGFSSPVSTTIGVHVLPVNDVPVITGLHDLAVDEDGVTSITFSVSDVEAPVDSLTVGAVSSALEVLPAENIELVRDNGVLTLRLTPARDAFGTALVTLTVGDGDAETTETLTLNIAPVNDAPMISAIVDQFILEGSGGTGELSFTVSDVDNDLNDLTVTATSDNGSLVPTDGITISGGGAEYTVNVVPASEGSGTARITIAVSDGAATSSSVFNVVVGFVNKAPMFVPGADVSVSEDRGSQVVPGWASGIIAGSADESGQLLRFVASASTPSLFSQQPTVDASTGDLRFTPAPNANGTTTITVQLVDDGGTENGGQDTSASIEFALTITPVNDPPEIQGSAVELAEGSEAAIPASAFGGYHDIDGDPFTFATITSLPAHGTLYLGASPISAGQRVYRAELGSLKYVPEPLWNGATSFSWTASDNYENSAPASTTLTVTAVDNPPAVSSIGSISVVEDGSGEIGFTVSDPDTNLATITVRAASSNPAVVDSTGLTVSGSGENRTIVVKPVPGRYGTAVITVTVSDGTNIITETFSVTVTKAPETVQRSNSNPGTGYQQDAYNQNDYAPSSFNWSRQSSGEGPEKPGSAWELSTGGAVNSSPAVGGDGTVYVGSDDGSLYAIDASGQPRWSFATGGAVGSSPAIGMDGTVYVGSADGSLYAVNFDGSARWSLNTGSPVASSPAISDNGVVYVASKDGTIHAVNALGEEQWHYDAGASVISSPAIGSDGRAYIGAGDGRLHALRPDGGLAWSFSTGGSIQSSPVLGTDGCVYVGSGDGKFYAVNPDGTLRWQTDLGSPITSSAAISADGNIYVGTADGKMHSVSTLGAISWGLATGGEVTSSPVVDRSGTVYFGSEDGKVYAVSAGGSPVWLYDAGGSVQSSPAICDGVLYFGSASGRVHALGSRHTVSLWTKVGSGGYKIDSTGKAFDQTTTFYNKTGVTVMALRLFEELGASFNYVWAPGGGTITMTYRDTTFTMVEGSDQMTVHDSSGERVVKLRTAVANRGGRAYIPTRDVNERMGFTVDWNAADDSITVTAR
jgi:outer membrane protein assembly factor BamB